MKVVGITEVRKKSKIRPSRIEIFLPLCGGLAQLSCGRGSSLRR